MYIIVVYNKFKGGGGNVTKPCLISLFGLIFHIFDRDLLFGYLVMTPVAIKGIFSLLQDLNEVSVLIMILYDV